MRKGLPYLLFALIIHEYLISMQNQIFDIYTAKLWEKQYVTYPYFPFSLYLLFWRVKTQVNVNKLVFYSFCTHYWHAILFRVFFLGYQRWHRLNKIPSSCLLSCFFTIACLISKRFGKLLWQNDGSCILNIHRNHCCLTLITTFIYMILL